MKIQLISSKGHYDAGWFSKPDRVEYLKNEVLNNPEFEIESAEVSSISELENVLDRLTPDTLVWTNAYYIDTEDGSIAWLNEFVEKRGFPLLGSSAPVLESLLRKDVCQGLLDKQNLPIPAFEVLYSGDIDKVESFFFECKLDYPVVLKATTECASRGIGLAKNLPESIEKARQILNDFPGNDLIVEEFLPNDDLTCGYFEMGEDIILMPTHYRYKNKPGKYHVYASEDRLPAVNLNRAHVVITEKPILKQLESTIPQIVEALNIRDITRIDGRMDEKGEIRYFDINGFPGLGHKVSNSVLQSFLFFPKYSQDSVYKALINTIVAGALIRTGLPVPKSIQAHNFFTLESDLVIRTKKRKKRRLYLYRFF